MSYTVDGDGKVTFQCQGKDCGKKQETRSLKVLPKKWCITGILITEHSPEDGGAAESDHERLMEANKNLSGHFCSLKCAKNTFADPRVEAMVRKLKVAVVVYKDCVLVVDGEGGAGGGDEDRPRGKRGSRDDDPDGGEGERPSKPKGLDRPSGSPPPFELPPGAGGF